MTMTILTAKGEAILVDDEDYAALSMHRWSLCYKGYPRRSVAKDGKRRYIAMHRQVLGLKFGDGHMVDHINGNPLDCRKANLRRCTLHQNNFNVKKPKTNSSGFKGVHRYKGKWCAKIQFHRKTKHLGYFDDPALGHELYCLAADLLFGEFARYD